MARTRLTVARRELLTAHAIELTEQLLAGYATAIEEATAALQQAALHEASTVFTENDMAVLRKFDLVAYVGSLAFCLDEIRTRPDFTVRLSNDILPWPATAAYSMPGLDKQFTWLVTSTSGPVHLAYQARCTACNAYDNEANARLSPYKTLIREASTFEAVVEVWPEAAALTSAICGPGTALIRLTGDMQASIARDVEMRAMMAGKDNDDA